MLAKQTELIRNIAVEFENNLSSEEAELEDMVKKLEKE